MKELILLLMLMSKPINATPIVCPTPSAQCTYTDSTPNVGTDTYFVEAENSGNTFSVPSNAVTVTVPSTGHTVSLTWNASSASGVTHWVFRTSPPSGLLIITTH